MLRFHAIHKEEILFPWRSHDKPFETTSVLKDEFAEYVTNDPLITEFNDPNENQVGYGFLPVSQLDDQFIFFQINGCCFPTFEGKVLAEKYGFIFHCYLEQRFPH